jgi:hypothetical protein
MELTFKRKSSKSLENRAAVITIPRAIAQSWEQYDSLELTFNGTSLTIVPKLDGGQA